MACEDDAEFRVKLVYSYLNKHTILLSVGL